MMDKRHLFRRDGVTAMKIIIGMWHGMKGIYSNMKMKMKMLSVVSIMSGKAACMKNNAHITACIINSSEKLGISVEKKKNVDKN